MSVSAARTRLVEGNRRFVSGARSRAVNAHEKCESLALGQEPFAVVVGCSDSRVPPELVFDQGLGDLFVVRVAGNIVAPSQLGSVEFAVQTLGTRLVVVLGHSNCGAICATVDGLQKGTVTAARSENSIVGLIRPGIEKLLTTDLRHDRDALVEAAVRANVRVAVEQLQASELLAARVRAGELEVLGAEYALATGEVEFLD